MNLNSHYNYFSLFYYNQILRLSPLAVGINRIPAGASSIQSFFDINSAGELLLFS